MPALTHNRVKNGFNGGRRLLNANAGIKFGRTVGSTNSDATRSKALVGGIGSKSKFARRAIQRRGITSESAACCNEKIRIELAIITQVDNLIASTTPTIVFRSASTGIVMSNKNFTTSSIVKRGNNSLTFNIQNNGIYDDIWIQIFDEKRNNFSDKVYLDKFEIDSDGSTRATLKEIKPIPTPSNDLNPRYTFNSNRPGTVKSNTLTITSGINVSKGNNTITFSFPAGTNETFTGRTITVTDFLGNEATQTITEFKIDATKPALTSDIQVRTPSTNTTPTFGFSTTKIGTLVSNYLFSSSAVITATGSNSVKFNALAANTYSDVYIKVNDSLGNSSDNLSLAAFEIITEATNTFTMSINATADRYLITDQLSAVNNEGNPSLTLQRGKLYIFNLSSIGSGAPFIIHTNNTTGINTAPTPNVEHRLDTASYYKPVDANGDVIPFLEHSDGTVDAAAQDKTSGTLSLIIPANAPAVLYYRSSESDNLIGEINIV